MRTQAGDVDAGRRSNFAQRLLLTPTERPFSVSPGCWRLLIQSLLVFSVAILFVVNAGNLSFAHKVNVIGYVEGNDLVVEGYFAGKARAMDCLVEVFSADGTKLAEGRTDAKGFLRLPVAPLTGKGDLKLLIHAGSGHQAEYTVKNEDLGGPPPVLSDPVSGTGPAQPEPRSVDLTPAPIDPKLLQEALGRELDAKLAPIMRLLEAQRKSMVEQQNKGPGVVEIFGGIGWIFGLIGVGAYFLSLKTRKGEPR